MTTITGPKRGSLFTGTQHMLASLDRRLHIAGEWLARRDRAQASRAGLAAGISFLLGIVAKVGIAFTMVGIFAVAWLV